MIRPATLADLRFVFADLSAVTRQEIEAAGVAREWLLDEFSARMHVGDALTCDVDGPLFMLGSNAGPLDTRSLWFAATERYFEMGARGVLIGRRTMTALRRRHPGAAFESVSWSRHPKCAHWFSLLGFNPVARGDGKLVFRHVANRVSRRA